MSDKCPNCGYSGKVAAHKVLNGTMSRYVHMATGEVVVMAGNEVGIRTPEGDYMLESEYKKQAAMPKVPSVPTAIPVEPTIKNREIPEDMKVQVSNQTQILDAVFTELREKQQDKTIEVAPNGSVTVGQMSATEKLAQMRAAQSPTQ